jgi:hypothetical protein
MERWTTGWGIDRYPDSWKGSRVTSARSSEHAVTGFAAAKLTGRQSDSILYQDVTVDPATQYRLTVHMALISGSVWVQVQDLEDESYYWPGKAGPMLATEKSMQEYGQTFTTLGEPGGAKRTVRVRLRLQRRSAAYFDQVRLFKLETEEGDEKE